MKEELFTPNINLSNTRSFEFKGHRVKSDHIDWSMQTKIENQTRIIYSDSQKKRVKITVHRNVKGW